MLGNGVIEICRNRRQLRKHPTWDSPTPLEIRQRHDQGPLRVRVEPDTRHYVTRHNPAPLRVAVLAPARDNFHGDWNHTLHPVPVPVRSHRLAAGSSLTGVPRRELGSLIDQIADDWQMVTGRDLTRHTGCPRLRPSARGIGQLEYHHRVPAALPRAPRRCETHDRTWSPSRTTPERG